MAGVLTKQEFSLGSACAVLALFRLLAATKPRSHVKNEPEDNQEPADSADPLAGRITNRVQNRGVGQEYKARKANEERVERDR